MDPGPLHRPITPFNDKLGTNYAPSLEERTLLKSFNSGPLDLLGAQVLQAQRALEQLLIQQNELKAATEAYHILCHPLRQLPDELLVEIFTNTLPSSHLPVLDPSEPPIVLTHICQRWRRLSLSTPSLWTSVHIPVPTKWSDKDSDDRHVVTTQRRAACLEWWLANSGRKPLTLSLYWPHDSPPRSNGREYRYILPFTLHAHLARISDLTLDVPDEVSLRLFADVRPEDLKMLERVSLHGADMSLAQEGSIMISIWDAPTLKKVFWARSCVASIIRMPGLQWDRLQEVSIMNGVNVSNALNMVGASPTLVKLSIVLVEEIFPVQPQGMLGGSGRTRSPILDHLGMRFVVLPRLTTLYIAEQLRSTNRNQRFVRTFLEYLQLPSLRNLTHQLSGKDSTEVGDAHPLLRFLESQVHDPHLPLTRLKISSAISRTVLVDCLARVPKLEYLWLGNGVDSWLRSFEALAASTSVIWDDRLLLAMSTLNPLAGQANEIICPRLRSFTVDKARFTFQRMRDFVRARQVRDGNGTVGNNELEHLSIGLDYVAPPGPDWKTLMDDLEILGVRATMTFEKPRAPLDGYMPKDGLKGYSDIERGLWDC